jgi:vacuolar-type H+-ATPase subunit H
MKREQPARFDQALAEAAIARALQAEQDARAAIEQCERDAANLVADARRRGREVAERTEASIARLQARMSAATARRLEAIEREAAALATDRSSDAALRGRIEDAVAALAAELSEGP